MGIVLEQFRVDVGLRHKEVKRVLKRQPEMPRYVEEYLRTTPPDTLVAGHPQDVQPVSLTTGRATLVNRETLVPYYKRFYEEVARPRSEAAINAYYAGDWEAFDTLYNEYGVDAFYYVRPKPMPQQKPLEEPLEAMTVSAIERLGDRQQVITDPPEDRILARDTHRGIWLLRVGPLRDELPLRRDLMKAAGHVPATRPGNPDTDANDYGRSGSSSSQSPESSSSIGRVFRPLIDGGRRPVPADEAEARIDEQGGEGDSSKQAGKHDARYGRGLRRGQFRTFHANVPQRDRPVPHTRDVERSPRDLDVRLQDDVHRPERVEWGVVLPADRSTKSPGAVTRYRGNTAARPLLAARRIMDDDIRGDRDWQILELKDEKDRAVGVGSRSHHTRSLRAKRPFVLHADRRLDGFGKSGIIDEGDRLFFWRHNLDLLFARDRPSRQHHRLRLVIKRDGDRRADLVSSKLFHVRRQVLM